MYIESKPCRVTFYLSVFYNFSGHRSCSSQPALSHLQSQVKLTKTGNGHYQKELMELLKLRKDKDGSLLEASFKGEKHSVAKE